MLQRSLLHNKVLQTGSYYARVTWICVPLLLPIGRFRAECDRASWACSWGVGMCRPPEREGGSVQELSGEGPDSAFKHLIMLDHNTGASLSCTPAVR